MVHLEQIYWNLTTKDRSKYLIPNSVFKIKLKFMYLSQTVNEFIMNKCIGLIAY